MSCREVRRYVQAFVDGELDPQHAMELERHLGACPECARSVEFERWFKGEIRRSVGAVLAPAGMQGRIHGALVQADRSDRIRLAAPRVGAFAALAAAVAAALLVPGWLSPGLEQDGAVLPSRPVIDYVAERHSRSLPVEVTGPDATSVSLWFRDKVDFAVNPPAFESGAVQLVGGRLSNVGDRQAAHLLYDHGGRRITVVVFDGAGMPRGGAQPLRAGTRTVYVGESRGYPVAFWQQGGVDYALSSDLPRQDFVRLVSSVH